MEDLKMNYSEMNNDRNKEMIDKVMINKNMYNQDMNVEENNSGVNNSGVNNGGVNNGGVNNSGVNNGDVNNSELNNFVVNNSDVNNFEEFGVDDILDIYIPESSDNIESPDIDNNNDKDNMESKLNNVVFYKQDSDEIIIIRNDLKNKWNNRNSLPY